MKLLLLLLAVFFFLNYCQAQNQFKDTSNKRKWYRITNNDIAVMATQFGAGYATGWREEVVYHAPALFRRFPNLNRRFWDSRLYHRHNANHYLKTASTSLHAIGIVIKVGGKKQNWKHYVVDGIKFYGAYKLGFFAAYNITHKNKFTF